MRSFNFFPQNIHKTQQSKETNEKLTEGGVAIMIIVDFISIIQSTTVCGLVP